MFTLPSLVVVILLVVVVVIVAAALGGVELGVEVGGGVCVCVSVGETNMKKKKKRLSCSLSSLLSHLGLLARRFILPIPRHVLRLGRVLLAVLVAIVGQRLVGGQGLRALLLRLLLRLLLLQVLLLVVGLIVVIVVVLTVFFAQVLVWSGE